MESELHSSPLDTDVPLLPYRPLLPGLSQPRPLEYLTDVFLVLNRKNDPSIPVEISTTQKWGTEMNFERTYINGIFNHLMFDRNVWEITYGLLHTGNWIYCANPTDGDGAKVSYVDATGLTNLWMEYVGEMPLPAPEAKYLHIWVEDSRKLRDRQLQEEEFIPATISNMYGYNPMCKVENGAEGRKGGPGSPDVAI